MASNLTATDPKRLIVFGGNGYVGCKVLEVAAGRGIACVSVSRSGDIPLHLQQSRPHWLQQVEWIKGDAGNPDFDLLHNATALISLVGSPPVPTFTEAAFEQQLWMNGTTTCRLIDAAKAADIGRVVVLGAHIPLLMRSKRFAYYLGKEQGLESARAFADSSPGRSAVVLQPSAIYGTRYTRTGTPIPLWFVMAPVAWLMSLLPEIVREYLPESPVSVDKVATLIVDAAIDNTTKEQGFSLLENKHILAAST